MRIAAKHSHLNGEEWLLVHEKETYAEIISVIQAIDAEECRTRISRERGMKGKALYSPVDINREFDRRLSERGWKSVRYSYYVAPSLEHLEVMSSMSSQEQRDYLEDHGYEPIYSYNQTDHVKQRIAIEVQFGKYSFVAYDLFVKHLALYNGHIINVGVEILPTKAMQREMSSGIAYYEGELHNVFRHGRNNPPVPLVIIGVEPD